MTVITGSGKIQKIRDSFWNPDSYLSLTIMDRHIESKKLKESSGLTLAEFLEAGEQLLTDEDFEMASEMEEL